MNNRSFLNETLPLKRERTLVHNVVDKINNKKKLKRAASAQNSVHITVVIENLCYQVWKHHVRNEANFNLVSSQPKPYRLA